MHDLVESPFDADTPVHVAKQSITLSPAEDAARTVLGYAAELERDRTQRNS
jgi:hypothetical protein